jgi:hypothetical protein
LSSQNQKRERKKEGDSEENERAERRRVRESRKAERKRGEQRKREEVSRRGRHHHQLPLLQNQEPDRARQGAAS